MSNPALRALADAVKAFPELRVGQIIVNAMTTASSYGAGQTHPDVFYTTDEYLAGRINDFVARHKKG